jgi:hypothetical protein
MKAIFHFSPPVRKPASIGDVSRQRYAEGIIRNLKFQPHSGEYISRFSGRLECVELGTRTPVVEIHFEAEAAVAHPEGVRVEYRTKRWYFFEEEFHLFLPVRLQAFFEQLCFNAERTRELIDPALSFLMEGDLIASGQSDARLGFALGQTFFVELSPR